MSLILLTATRVIVPLVLLLSVFLLLRGHNEPGGGFIGGLVAVAAFALYALAAGIGPARRLLRVEPHVLAALGLLLAAGSGVPAVLGGEPFLTGQWVTLRVAGVAEVDLGTVLAFDIGVYLVVLGVVLMILLTLAED